MIDYKLIGKRIKRERERQSITQEVLADHAEITVVYLSRIENGRVHPTLEVLHAICAYLKYDLGMLFGGTATEQPSYQQDRVNHLFRSLPPSVKPIALEVLESLAKLK